MSKRHQKLYAAIIRDLKKLDAVELLEEASIPAWQKKELRKRLKDLRKTRLAKCNVIPLYFQDVGED